MKKIIAILLILVSITTLGFAGEKRMGAGGVVGYPFNGAVFAYDITDKWDAQGGLGYYMGTIRYKDDSYGYLSSYHWPISGFAVDLYSGYEVYRVNFDEKNSLGITVGGNVDLIFATYGGYFSVGGLVFTIGAMVTPGICYEIPNIGLELFLRIPLGVNISFAGSNRGGVHVGFAGGGQLGCLYRF